MLRLRPIILVGTTKEQRRRTVGVSLVLPALPVALPATRLQGGIAPPARLVNERDRCVAAAAAHPAALADRRSIRGALRVAG